MQSSAECLCVVCNCMCQCVVVDKMYVNINCLLITSAIRKIIILTSKKIYSRCPVYTFPPVSCTAFLPVFPLE